MMMGLNSAPTYFPLSILLPPPFSPILLFRLSHVTLKVVPAHIACQPDNQVRKTGCRNFRSFSKLLDPGYSVPQNKKHIPLQKSILVLSILSKHVVSVSTPQNALYKELLMNNIYKYFSKSNIRSES